MMMVVTLIPRLRGGQVLIIASIATPIYRSVVVRAREAVLRDDLKKVSVFSHQPSASILKTED
jgi:hypothetical protein